jgi:hypothetical protein
MNETTRREVVRVAAMAGVAMLAGAASNEALAADSKSNDALEQAERQRVVACGMTEAEAECWILASKAAAAFFALPALHEMDQHEVSHAIHVVQQKLLSRPAYRHYKEMLKAQPK